MPLVEIEPDVLLDTSTGMRLVHEPDSTQVTAYPVGSPPLIFTAANWAAIRAHVAPPPTQRIAAGLEELCDRLAKIERRVEMVEQETADGDAVDALAGQVKALAGRVDAAVAHGTKQVEALLDRIHGVTGRLDSMQGRNMTAATKIDDLARRLGAAESGLERRDEVLGKIRAQISAIENWRQNRDKESLGVRVARLEADLFALGDRVGAMREPAAKVWTPRPGTRVRVKSSGNIGRVIMMSDDPDSRYVPAVSFGDGPYAGPFRIDQLEAAPEEPAAQAGGMSPLIQWDGQRWATLDGRPTEIDPHAPRRFRWPEPGGSGEWRYGVYWPGEGLMAYPTAEGKLANVRARPGFVGVEWLDPAPEPVTTMDATCRDCGGDPDADGHHAGPVS